MCRLRIYTHGFSTDHLTNRPLDRSEETLLASADANRRVKTQTDGLPDNAQKLSVSASGAPLGQTGSALGTLRMALDR
jgi:hypothetical protein